MTTALIYTILPGDTLYAIANGFAAAAGVGTQAIEVANPKVDPNNLQIGTPLNIPALNGSGTALRYTVQAGDSFSKLSSELATCSGMTVADITAANPGIQANNLAAGQLINIPETASNTPTNPSEPNADVISFWRWTWSETATPPTNTNLSIAFSGYVDPAEALSNSEPIKSSLQGSKYIALGGGNGNGAWTEATLTAITNAINAGDFAGYNGIAYDVEEGESGLETAFQQSFAAAKAKGYHVLVTVSHSAPYDISDASTLIQSFFADPNIDYLSPQLYTTGTETSNDYATSGGVTWSEYATAKAAVVPSIVQAGMYSDAQDYFETQGVSLNGFIQWSQT